MAFPPDVHAAHLVRSAASEFLTDELPVGEFPALRGMGFGEAELAALRRQGHLSREQRGPEQAPIFKLCYRWEGRRRVRYLGSDPALISAIRQELAVIQQAAKRHRKMQRVLRLARRGLRQAKSTMAPVVAAAGCYFHGFAIRRRRRTRAPQK
jgi:hypothetical protein